MKTSTIFIGKGDRTHVFHSVNEVPKDLRDELEASTNGFNSATILIADRRGRQEIIRALNGLPTGLRTRLSTSLQAGSSSTEAMEPSHVSEMQSEVPETAPPLFHLVQNSRALFSSAREGAGQGISAWGARRWAAAILLPPAVALLVWLALNVR